MKSLVRPSPAVESPDRLPLRCPFCLGPLARGKSGRSCAPCDASFPRTPEGIPVLVDLTRGDSPALGGGDLSRKPLADYPAIQATCRANLEGALDLPQCPQSEREGPLYRRFVEWPVEQVLAMAGHEELEGARILHIGPGLANEVRLLAPLAPQLVGLDIAANFLRCTVQSAREQDLPYEDFFVGAAEFLPFADDSFDAVLLHKTVQWWHDADAGLREAFRVGRRVLIVAEPTTSWSRKLAQRLGIANRKSPVTGRAINETSLEQLRRILPPTASIRVKRYLGKAIDSAAPRRSIVRLDRRRWVGRAVVAGIVALNLVAGRWGNQVCAVIEKEPAPR